MMLHLPYTTYLGQSSPGNLKIIIKAMRSVAGSSGDLKLSFFNLDPQQPGGYNCKPGRGGGQNFQRAQNTQGRGVSMDQMYVYVCRSFNNQFQTCTNESSCISRDNPPFTTQIYAGRLGQYLPNWVVVTQDRWILNTV